ncbi:hypothetical protein [Candidatus Tisiphia endosymbiont of Nemotelus uliginosus]|uniref:hypothetical protein n=1 Tax=Candidatus Tisiphia endosymbiont of Nemotelus uliginosus TaxID=3077926 RepID=UPI0035C8C22E
MGGKNLNNVTLSGLTSRSVLGRTNDFELLPLVLVLIASVVCLVGVMITVVKLVYYYCNKPEDDEHEPEEVEVTAPLDSHSDPDIVEAEEHNKKLTGEGSKTSHYDSGAPDAE